MYNIVLSGGPCAGKSTSLSKIESELTEKLGKKVFIVPETATELIANGIYPCDKISMEDFQDIVFRKQLEKENLYRDIIAKYYNEDDVVVLYDRSFFDQLAYVDKKGFNKLLKKYNVTMADLISRYDLVLHLVTAAKGTDCYTTENNTARRETKEEAIEADEKTLKGNMNHPKVRVIDNSTNFEKKINRVLQVIFDLLDAPLNPSEIERKYLIEYPTQGLLNNLTYSSKTEIVQTYLKTVNDGEERRVRQRGTKEDGFSFYYTEKVPVSDIERIEREKKINVSEYVAYLAEANSQLHQIHKTRYCFVYKNQYFEMDLYPYSDKYAIVEIELASVDSEVVLPDFLTIVKEVTDDIRYKNFSIAKNLTLDNFQ